MAQLVKNLTDIHEDVGLILVLLSGLRKNLALLQAVAWVTDVAWISHCCGCDVDCNSDLTPSLGTSIYLRCSQKNTNKSR